MSTTQFGPACHRILLSLALAACGDATATSEGLSAASAATQTAGTTTTGLTTGLTTGGAPTDGTSTVSASASDGTSEAVTRGTSGFLFDIPVDDLGNNCEGSGCGESEFSYIWIADPAGTVSKINTVTLVEEARYYTRPDGMGNPSRTSVNLSGRAVAVANRYGGVVKIWANLDDCVESNGAPGIQTSQGAGDLLAWGEDECIAWYTAFPTYATQRPVAWDAGELNPATCQYENERLWTAGCPGPFMGGGDGGPTQVHRLDGATGDVLDTVALADLACDGTGPYGGAVDIAGNFWTFVRGTKKLARIDAKTLEPTIFPMPDNLWAYGITVDSKSRPWVSAWQTNPMTNVGGARFDPVTETWDLLDSVDFSSLGGLQEGTDGRMWVATIPFGANSPDGVLWFDSETLEPGDQIVVDNGQALKDVKGVSIDGEGYVWAVTLSAAYKIDPDTYALQAFNGLQNAYTYSDMTGWGLSNSTCPAPR